MSTKACPFVTGTTSGEKVFPAPSLAVILLLGGVISAISGPSIASAQGPVPTAVMPFEGSGGLVVRRSVIHALEDVSRVSVIDEGLVDAAVERTGASTTGASGIDGLARQLSVRLVIQGEVAGRPTRRSLDLVARDASGRQVATQHARLPQGGAGRRALDDALGALLDAAIPQLGSAPSEPVEQPVSSGSTSSTSRTTSTSTASTTTVSSSPSSSSASTSTPSSSGSGEWGVDPALFTIAAGITVRSRDASVTLTDGTSRSYSLSPYAEIYARLETRPLAHEQGYARGVYAWGDFAYGLTFNASGPSGSVSTTFYRFSVHAGYLVPFAQVFEVGASIGGGYEAYELGANTAMATATYPYLRPAIRARVRAVGEMLVLDLEGGYRALFDRGGLSSAFGPNGSSFGWDIGGGVSGTFDFGLYYGVQFQWVQYVHDFSGTPATLGSGDHGTDDGYRFILTLGYGIR